MRWLADECVSAALVARLRHAGHDVVYLTDFVPGATDTQVLQRARDEHRLLLTLDKDFGDLVFRANQAVPGLVLVRIDPDRELLIWDRLRIAIESFGNRLLGRYLVIDPARFRSRPLLRLV